MKDSSQSRSFDDMINALAAVQRRRLLVALLEHNPQDDGPTVAAGDDAAEEELLVTMRHAHLPKLVDYGFVEWDEAAGEVSKGPKFDQIRPLLELLVEHEEELPEGWL